MKIKDGLDNRVAPPQVRLIAATCPDRNTEKIKFRSRYNIMAIKNQRFLEILPYFGRSYLLDKNSQLFSYKLLQITAIFLWDLNIHY